MENGETRDRSASRRTDEDLCYGCREDEWGEDSERVWAAIDESVKRFVSLNQENIGKSGKEKIASASYSGGMIDMVMVIKHALGNWAVGQLLDELERWQARDDEEDDVEEEEDSVLEIGVRGGPGNDSVAPEVTRELDEKIAYWMEQHKVDTRRQVQDPMFG